MKNKRILLALLALALAATTVLPAAMAYFTTNARATGSRQLKLGGTTTITETMAEWTKQVTISADTGSQPMWVRARAYPAELVDSILAETADDWESSEDGWWYFTTPLAKPADNEAAIPGTVTDTSRLLVKIEPVKVDEVGQIPDAFDVVVVYESAPVLYGEDGERLDCKDKKVWEAAAAASPAGT